MATQTKTVAERILHNSLWYGLETVIEAIVFLGSSIAVARYLGPEKLGYFSYINFFVAIVTRTSGTGLASATRKYMSEFLALDQPGTARAVYHLAYRYQLMGAITITLLSLAGVWLFGDPNFKTMASILILSIIPGVMSWVPAQANQAFEDVSQNTLSAFAYILSYTAVIVLTIHFHWDLIGVASALLVGRTAEVILRTIPLHHRLKKIPLALLEHDLKQRIRTFCLQSMGIQLLMSVVWDRSEMIFLRAFSSLDQIAFYSVSFGLANNLLLLPRTFGSAAGITLMVESVKDATKVDGIVRNTVRYLMLVVFPVHLGAAAIASQAVRLVYGSKYAGAVPVLIVAAILSIPRAFQEIPEVLLRSADKQQKLLVWLSLTGVLNIALDFALIPRYGAVGAAWGNGVAQSVGIFIIWQLARKYFTFSLPVLNLVRLLSAGLVSSCLAWLIARAIPGFAGLAAAIGTACVTYPILVRVFHGLETSDRLRLASIGDRLPRNLQKVYLVMLSLLIPKEAITVS